jgi:hypothetical protein
MRMRNLLPAALAVALTLVAGFYFLHRDDAPGTIAPVADGGAVE